MIRLYHRNTAIGVKSIPFNQQCNIPWRLGISWLSNLFFDDPVEKWKKPSSFALIDMAQKMVKSIPNGEGIQFRDFRHTSQKSEWAVC